MQVLVVLSGNAGQVVSRRELLDTVWPNQLVRDDTLSRCISQIRKVLGPNSIETVPKIGYRLTLPIEAAAATVPQNNGAKEPEITLAVLPFTNYSAEGSKEFFADSLTGQVIAGLARIADIRVISRTSAMVFKDCGKPLQEIAQQLGANRIIEGSVSFDEQDVRVTVQLIDAATDSHLWSDSYHYPFARLLQLQDEIVRTVLSALRPKLSAHELPAVRARSVDPKALELILRANHLIAQRDLESFGKARRVLANAAEIAPDHAPVWASLADVIMLIALYGGEPPTALVDDINDNADRALALNERQATARYTKAMTLAGYARNYGAALRLFEEAQRISSPQPMHRVAFGNLLWALGRGQDALAEVREAERQDPLNPGISMNVADYLVMARDYERALAQVDDLLELNENFVAAVERRARIRALIGIPDRALIDLDRIRRIVGDRGWNGTGAALILALTGRHDDARRILDARARDDAYADPLDFARVYAAMDDEPETIHWLERAFINHSFGLMFLNASPYFDSVRSCESFVQLTERFRPD